MAHRVNASLSEDEVAALQAHPDYRGSLGGLLRVLAMRQLGREADPYADHRSRPRDERGRILPAGIAREEAVGNDPTTGVPSVVRLKVYPGGSARIGTYCGEIDLGSEVFASEAKALLAWDEWVTSARAWNRKYEIEQPISQNG